MSENVEKNQENFKWGIRIGVNSHDSDLKVYKSFTYQGVQYSLFDCVYMYREGAKETDIGKLVKIWGSKKGGRRGKVLWFFRPIEIYHYLRDYEPSWNELFLASGKGKGVSNIIPLEAIVGKCNVVCTSKDSRNNLPSGSDLGKANYFFSHTFDVVNLRISDTFPDTIDTIKVERLFNWNQDKSKAIVECRIAPTAGARVKDESIHSAENPVLETPTTSEYFEHHISKDQPLKKRKILVASEANPLCSSQDTRRWFCKLPFEERIKEAHENGALIHLVNLDPSYTSSDVENIISSAFQRKADAKMVVEVPFVSSSYGQALVVFRRKDDADFVMNELNKKCLIVGEGRPLIAWKGSLNEPDVTCNFPGHLFIDKLLKIKSEKRKAVSTSHCAQANTIEHDMALQWRLLQKRFDLWWEALHEDQAKEISSSRSLITKSSQSGEHKAAEAATAS